MNLEAAEIRLRDGKTGARMVPLSGAAVSVLSALPRPEDNPWVIVGRKPGAHLTDLQHPWRRIRARANFDDVRIHDLRHCCATGAHLYEISSACRRREFLYPIVLVFFSKHSPQSPQRI